MASQLIQINTADDLSNMNGWMIYDFRREPDGKIAITLSNIMAPNKVKVSITTIENFNFRGPSDIHIDRALHFETEDIPNV